MTEAAHTEPQETSRSAQLERLENLADTMDMAFRLPVIGMRIGWDSILGLIPGIGDTIALAPGLYIIGKAHGMGAPAHITGRMAVNSAIDYVIGTIPFLGDIFDIGFKANRKNVALLRRHFDA